MIVPNGSHLERQKTHSPLSAVVFNFFKTICIYIYAEHIYVYIYAEHLERQKTHSPLSAVVFKLKINNLYI